MKRRIFSVLIALALCLSLLPAPALAEGAGTADNPWICGDGVTAVLDSGTLTISGSGDMTDYSSASEVPWNGNQKSIQKVVIENGVTSIGAYAFYRHGFLTNADLPSSLTTISGRAFTYCPKLADITIPNGVKLIGSAAFSYSGLVSVTIPPSVTRIYNSTFENCDSLTEVDIPASVKTIESYAFSSCNSLVKVEIPASVTKIESNVFYSSPNAKIYYEGTLDEWNAITNGKSGATDDQLVINPHEVTIVDGGTGATGAGTYSEGAAVTVSAGTKFGYAFDGWTVTGVTLAGDQAANPNLTFTMPANDVTLTANWVEAVARVDNVGYTTVQAAFDAIGGGSGIVYLLKDVTVEQAVTMSGGTVTLESEGKTLTGTDLHTLRVTGGTLTLENVTVENNTGSSWGINASSAMPALPPKITIRDTATVSGSSGGIVQTAGSLTVEGTVTGTGPSGKGISAMNMTLTINEGAVISGGSGDNAAGISQDSGTLTVNGGTTSGHVGLSVEASFGNLTVRLTGGTFTGSGGNAIEASGPNGQSMSLSELLDSGYTIYKADGTALTADELTSDRTGPGTFTVGCAHASVGTVTASDPDENGVVTVTATCQKCKEEVTLGTLTMVGSGKTITYGDDVPEFGVESSGAFTVTGYEWEGQVVFPLEKNNPQISPLISSVGTCSCSCTVTLGNTGGTIGSVKLNFTMTMEAADIAEADQIILEEGANQVVYDGKEHCPAPDKITIMLNESAILTGGYAEISLLDASGNAAATRTNAGTYKIKLTGKDLLKGTVTLESPAFAIERAKPAIEWVKDTEEQCEYTGNPVVPGNKPTVTVAGMDSYDGEPFTYSHATAVDGPYTPGLPTNAGVYYVKAAIPEQTNYAYAVTAGTLELAIAKATPTLTPPTPKDLTYNGKPQALVTAAEASVGTVQYALSANGPWSTAIPTATAPGDYTVWYKVDGTANYTGVEAASVPAKIEKATVTAIGPSLPVKNNQEKTYTLDLRPYLPTLPQGQEYGKLTYELTAVDIGDPDYIVKNTVKLVDTVLTVPVNKVDKTDEGSVAIITVTIQSDNFQDICLTVSVTATNKTPLIITGVTAQGWTYDGTVHPGYTGTPRAGGYTGEFLVTYFTKGKDRKDAGTFSVEFTPKDPGYEGALELPYTVEPAQVTVKADNQTATVGDAMPELTWRVVSGLASGETLKTNPTPACDADMSKAGTYPITISGGAVPDGGNYKAEIVYQNGTLTVSEKTVPPKPVDPKPPVDPDDLEVKLEVKEGFTEVPPALRALEHLNTPEKLTQVMRTAVTRTGVSSGNTAVYDVSLMVSTDGGRTWVPATSANFPSGGLTVTLPYPAGTDSGYTFTVVHMFTSAAFGKTPGDTESPAVTNTEAGLQFTVTGLSPISVGWKAKTTGTGGSSSGGGGSRPMSSVTVERAEHGKVTSDRSSAGSGSSVTLTVQPDRGYRLESLTVTDSRGNKLQLTDKGGGKYAFTMSGGNVTVKAVFAPLADSGACDGGAACPSRAFTDLKSGAWYHEAVDFVLRNGLMNGYGNSGSSSGSMFGPEDRLSRAQFAQILYNKEGRPAGAGSAPFTDVAPDAWCAPAVAWAAEQGIAGAMAAACSGRTIPSPGSSWPSCSGGTPGAQPPRVGSCLSWMQSRSEPTPGRPWPGRREAA